MFATLVLPAVLAFAGPAPVPAQAHLQAPEENRTQIALDFASQYIDLNATKASTSDFFGPPAGTCVLVGEFGDFCTFRCDGVLVLAECDAPPGPPPGS